ncbi:hypothetical protein [Streptomyces sp. NRRL F-5630]|uniref:hypothetical protein n=1 Tax=unclassified Streptomyces TaxID=2593676 RepID=UPI0004C8EA8C|nr:hypothetical protein [Streptomyces sp. NRRL F-5630]
MRTIPAALAAGCAVVVALGGGATPAWARQDSPGPQEIVVTPTSVPLGGRVTVVVRACAGGTVDSPGFPSARLRPVDGGDSATAAFTLGPAAVPGRYDVTAHCPGGELTRPAALTAFRGTVHGGVGGASAHRASPADMAVGGGLVVAAVLGGGVLWLRRRTEDRADRAAATRPGRGAAPHGR